MIAEADMLPEFVREGRRMSPPLATLAVVASIRFRIKVQVLPDVLKHALNGVDALDRPLKEGFPSTPTP